MVGEAQRSDRSLRKISCSNRSVADKAKLEEITADVLREIEEDCAWAESSPMPEAEQAAYGVFDNNIVPPAFRPEVLKN